MKNYKLKLTIMLMLSTLFLTSCGEEEDIPETTTPLPVEVVEPVTSDFIGMPKAEEIAVEHANATIDSVQNLSSSMDLSDESEIKYLVAFNIDETMYDYIIHAKSGEVLNFNLTNDNEIVVDVPENDDYIDEYDAREIAFTDANIFNEDVDFSHIKLTLTEDNKAIYDVEFYIGSVEYDYEIDALTGEILNFDNNAELFDVSIPEELIIGEAIGEEEAVRIARADADVDATSNLFVKLETNDDLSSHYWVEFLANNTQYGYEIQSVTGEILSKSSETDENAVDGVIVDQNDVESPYIGEGKAVSTAVNHAGSDPTSEITVDFEVTDTKSRYYVGFTINNTEYKYEIDGINGKIMGLDRETKNYGTATTSMDPNASVIGDEAALAIALKHVGADSASFIKVGFSFDDGVAVYEIDFRIDSTMHNFEVDAISGQILDYTKD